MTIYYILAYTEEDANWSLKCIQMASYYPSHQGLTAFCASLKEQAKTFFKIRYGLSVILSDGHCSLLISTAALNGMEYTLILGTLAHIATARIAKGILQGTWQHASLHMLKMLRKTVTARVQQTKFQIKFSGTVCLPIPILHSRRTVQYLLITAHFSSMSLFQDKHKPSF